MSFGRDTTAANIKPLEGAIVRRFTAGTTIAAGEIVVMMADGYVDPANTAAFTGAVVLGIALQAALVGERVDVVTFGPVQCLLEGTPANLVYASDTAGEPAESVGTKDVLVGITESATVLFVRPEFIDRS
jgi:hypothetical protein